MYTSLNFGIFAPMKASVAFYTLGCKLNFSESSTLSKQLNDKGFDVVDFSEKADVYVINTCSVTDNADKKCKKVVQDALQKNSKAKVAVIGCYAQLKPKEISELEGVDVVLGAAEKFQLADHLLDLSKKDKAEVFNSPIKSVDTFIPGYSSGDRTRTFLKVQDGCDYFCSFCTIPLARGKSRNASVAETVAQAEKAAQDGVKEIVLTGVNIGDFGQGEGENFFNLVKAMDEVEGIERFRISSIEPNLLSDEIIEFVAQSKKFVPHFHIPLQSGSDKLLQKMRRKYLSDLYVNRVTKIKELMPNACIGVDVIVGFPGETEEEFLVTYRFLNELPISYLHVFPYSQRANTTAKKLTGQVPWETRLKRSKMLRILSDKKKRAFYQSQLGKSGTVLFEGEEKNGGIQGFSENYLRVEIPFDPAFVNQTVTVEYLEINPKGNVEVTVKNAVPA